MDKRDGVEGEKCVCLGDFHDQKCRCTCTDAAPDKLCRVHAPSLPSIEGIELPTLDYQVSDANRAYHMYPTNLSARREAMQVDMRERQLAAHVREIAELRARLDGAGDVLGQICIAGTLYAGEKLVNPIKHASVDAILSQIARAEKAEAALAAMTADRDLWQGEHNEDCPNLAALSSPARMDEQLLQAVYAGVVTYCDDDRVIVNMSYEAYKAIESFLSRTHPNAATGENL